MKRQWKWIGVIFVLAATLSGCRQGGDGDIAQVRLINADSTPDPLTVSVDQHPVWKRLPYRDNSGYQKIKPGTYNVQIASESEVISKSIAFDKGSAYTVVAFEAFHTPVLSFRVFSDETKPLVPQDKARVFFINALETSNEADLLLNNIVAFPSLIYGHRSEPLLLAAGDYDVRVNPAGRISTVAGPITLHLDAGHSYTLVALGHRPSDTTLEIYPN